MSLERMKKDGWFDECIVSIELSPDDVTRILNFEKLKVGKYLIYINEGTNVVKLTRDDLIVREWE